MPRVVRRERLVPNIHLLEVEAPEIARKCRPGQFVIVMPDARGERIPLTIADWDRERGTVTRRVHDRRHDDAQAGPARERRHGPDLRRSPRPSVATSGSVGTVVLRRRLLRHRARSIPIARAYKEAGSRVIVVVDVKADYLLVLAGQARRPSPTRSSSPRDDGLYGRHGPTSPGRSGRSSSGEQGRPRRRRRAAPT
ncbi:MAG: hypothetical protein M0C28_15255 [Candidatus Moduliflexus flocculans]|nr:hypothetical protein [Candidatus Moduliflexus flocculans]